MSTALKLPTLDDYLDADADAGDDHKLEFIDGEIVAMAGGDPVHSHLAATLTQAIKNRLSGAPCLTFQSDLRVRVGDEDTYVYPDVTIACPPRQFLDTARGRHLAAVGRDLRGVRGAPGGAGRHGRRSTRHGAELTGAGASGRHTSPVDRASKWKWSRWAGESFPGVSNARKTLLSMPRRSASSSRASG